MEALNAFMGGGSGLGEYTFRRARSGRINVYENGEFRARVSQGQAQQMARSQRYQQIEEGRKAGQAAYERFLRKLRSGDLPPGVRTPRQFRQWEAREAARSTPEAFERSMRDPPAWQERREEAREKWRQDQERRRTERRERYDERREERRQRIEERRERQGGRYEERREEYERRRGLSPRERYDERRERQRERSNREQRRQRGASDNELLDLKKDPRQPAWKRRMAERELARRTYQGGGTVGPGRREGPTITRYPGRAGSDQSYAVLHSPSGGVAMTSGRAPAGMSVTGQPYARQATQATAGAQRGGMIQYSPSISYSMPGGMNGLGGG
jgi:hypothetical protein